MLALPLPLLLAAVLFSWLLLQLTRSSTHTPNSDVISGKVFYYMPYFFGGYLCDRHGLFTALVATAGRRPTSYKLVRAVAFAAWLAATVSTIVLGVSLNGLARVSLDGCCAKRGCLSDENGSQKDNFIYSVGTWERLGAPLRCILLQHLLEFYQMCVCFIWLPLHRLPFFTAAGYNTLVGICTTNLTLRWRSVTWQALRPEACPLESNVPSSSSRPP